MTDNLSIEDLEKHSGLSIRTLRYYMSMGLLPGPDTLGKYASYSQEHLDRLDLILILKEMHLPLDEIRLVMENLTLEEIREYRDNQEPLLAKVKSFKPEPEADQSKAHSSALDYIKGLEAAHAVHHEISDDLKSYSKDNSIIFNNQFSINRIEKRKPISEERWRRIELADGVELLTRETRDKEKLNKIRRLMSFGRSLFEE